MGVPASKVEIDWALKQLEALQYIKYTRDRQKFWLTETGIARGNDLFREFRIDERILMLMCCGEKMRDDTDG